MYEKDIRNGIHYNNKADQSRHIDTGSIPISILWKKD